MKLVRMAMDPIPFAIGFPLVMFLYIEICSEPSDKKKRNPNMLKMSIIIFESSLAKIPTIRIMFIKKYPVTVKVPKIKSFSSLSLKVALSFSLLPLY